MSIPKNNYGQSFGRIEVTISFWHTLVCVCVCVVCHQAMAVVFAVIRLQ